MIMMRCVVDIDKGFIARSVSPADRKSFYFDTSRDQYTHWIYGALRLYNSDLCTQKQRKDITDVLTAVAMRFENNVSEAKRLCSNTLTDFMYYQYKPWNKVKMQYLGIIGDKAYFNPGQSELYENWGFYAIRNVGEAVSILALCPNRPVGDEQLEALQNLSCAIDYSRHCSYAPMLLACGYWLAEEANMNIQKRKFASRL